jgi:lipopolysaccharide/colanic/teichoic acid biosynthesis glycosyltransferase
MTRGIKRLVDLIAALLILILFVPVMALVALAIRLTMGRSVFYRQVRPGYKTNHRPLPRVRAEPHRSWRPGG